jgi:hypothetical protein
MRLRSIVVVGVLAVAACSSSPAASTSGAGSSPGTASSNGAVVPTGGGTASQPGASTAANGGSAFPGAAGALDKLDSYSYSVDVTSSSAAGSVTTTSHTKMSGTVVHKPAEASSLLQQTIDASGNVEEEFGIVIIGPDAWVKGNKDAPYLKVPASTAGSFMTGIAAYRPEQLFGVYFAANGGAFTAVGTETKNGVASTHYKGDQSIGTLLGGITGAQGQWASDVWIANDGGFIVHSEAAAQGGANGSSGGFAIIVDVNQVNAATVTPPS